MGHNHQRLMFISIFILIPVLFLSIMTGCGGSQEDVGKELAGSILDPVQLTSRDNNVHYCLPDNLTYLVVYCEKMEQRSEKPVYVWKISDNEQTIDVIIHDTKPVDSNFSDETPPEDSKYTWPNLDYLEYNFKNEGTYTARVDLYSQEDYSRNKDEAVLLSSYVYTVYCTPLTFTIDVSPTNSEREYELKATASNPKLVPSFSKARWEFGHVSPVPSEAGTTKVLSTEVDLWAKGFSEVSHVFPKAGSYVALFSLELDGKVLARASANVDITSDFKIIMPTGPFKTGQEYTFSARTGTPEILPEDVYYLWDFGDGPTLSIPLSNEVTHVFTKPGPYAIHVGVFEPSDPVDMPVGSAVGMVDVEASANHLMELHKMKKFSLDFSVQHDYIEGMSGIYSWDMDSYGEVVWNGVNFSMEWSQYNHSERMTGQVSEDGTIIKQLKIRHEFVDSKGITEWFELEIVDLPFWDDPMPDRFIVDKSGIDIQEFVPYFNTYRTAGYQWTDDSRSRLYVRFEK
jgi:hypothetical protein